jgi:hypothetical protein
MDDTAKATRIRQVATVFAPVADQDRALEFYLDKLGFEKRGDFPYGEGSRWVEVAPSGSTMPIALVPPSASPPAATRPSARSPQKTSRLTMQPCAPRALKWTRRSRAPASTGRGSSRST